MKDCHLCDSECESVSHVLWECPAYSSIRDNFLVALQGELGDGFQSLDSFGKASFVLGSELWEDKFESMLMLVKGYILDIWELRKVRLYGDNPSVQQFQSQSAPGELQGIAGGRGESCQGGETDTGVCVCFSSVCSSVSTVCSICSGSAQCAGCVVDGPSAMASP